MVSKWSVGIDKKICGVYHDSNSQALDGDRQAIVPAKSEREGIDCLSQNPGFANRRIDGDEQTVSGGLRGVLSWFDAGLINGARDELTQRRSQSRPNRIIAVSSTVGFDVYYEERSVFRSDR